MVCFGVKAFGNAFGRVACGVALTLALTAPVNAQPAASSPASSAPVTEPELVTFVQAEYPEQARAQGLEGDVVLVLEIDENGTVTEATVHEPAGHGFDEAAVAAAKNSCSGRRAAATDP